MFMHMETPLRHVQTQGALYSCLGSGILVEKDILGFFKNIDLDNS